MGLCIYAVVSLHMIIRISDSSSSLPDFMDNETDKFVSWTVKKHMNVGQRTGHAPVWGGRGAVEYLYTQQTTKGKTKLLTVSSVFIL